jgi:signal peptidase
MRRLLDKRLLGVKVSDWIKLGILVSIVIVGLEARYILSAVTGSSTPIAVVEGYSMFPLLREGDLVFAYKPQPSQIHVGDIVIYRDLRGILVIHRVVRVKIVDGKYYYVTKGDNNEVPDYYEFAGKPGIPYSRIEGKVWEVNGMVFKLPYIGYLSIWYHGGSG